MGHQDSGSGSAPGPGDVLGGPDRGGHEDELGADQPGHEDELGEDQPGREDVLGGQP